MLFNQFNKKQISSTTHRSERERFGYTITETAQLLGISRRSIYRLIARGLIGRSHALRKIIIPRSEIEKFLSKTTEGI